MKNHCLFAISKYPYWFSLFGTILGVISIVSTCPIINWCAVILCFILPFVIPFIITWIKKDFKIKTIGMSDVTVSFGDIFEEECFTVTTTRYFDVDPLSGYISETSLIGKFVERFYHNNTQELEEKLKKVLPLDENNNIKCANYGKTICFTKDAKTVYFMAFTDREKKKQPKDFYIRAVRDFLNEISQANHGKTIAIPLLGENNNLSNTGFATPEMAFESLITMLNEFGIENPQYTLRIKIVVLPENKSELLKSIAFYSKML